MAAQPSHFSFAWSACVCHSRMRFAYFCVGCTHCAAERGHRDIVEALLLHGADVNAQVDQGPDALLNDSCACCCTPSQHSSCQCASSTPGPRMRTRLFPSRRLIITFFPLLPSPGPSVGMNNSSSLWVAARNGHAHVVQCLLSKGAAVNVPRGPDNSTPLWIACACGHVRVARDLLAGGADATVPFQQVHIIAVFVSNHVTWSVSAISRVIQLCARVTSLRPAGASCGGGTGQWQP